MAPQTIPNAASNRADNAAPGSTRERFGVPAVRCSFITAELPMASCAPPVVLHRRTRARGRVLFQSRDAGHQTLVVTGAPLRLTVRGAMCFVQLLAAAARPLLLALKDRLPSAVLHGNELQVPLVASALDPAALDREALAAPSLLDPVRQLVGLVGDRGVAAVPVSVYGAFGFDLVDHFEALGPRRADPCDEADLEVVLGLDVVRYCDVRGIVQVITRGLPWEAVAVVHARHAETLAALQLPAPSASDAEQPKAGACGPRFATGDDRQFVAAVDKLREHIAAGCVFQAVLSRAVTWNCTVDSLDVCERLLAREPSPYAFHLELERGALFGASPETCVRVVHGEVEIRPIAGTAARSSDSDGDARLALALLFDPKERAEHVMLLDLARNDVARVAVAGTTEVVQQFAIEKYSRVQHLVSRVRGTLRPELDALHAYRAAANMGTLSGAPKARATELLRALEPTSRGYYGGAVICLAADGSLDSCIVIRSMRAIDGVFRAQAGAGIVWHSDPERELEETERKLRTLCEVMDSFAGPAGEAVAQ